MIGGLTANKQRNNIEIQNHIISICCDFNRNKLAPYGTDGRLLHTANFKVK